MSVIRSAHHAHPVSTPDDHRHGSVNADVAILRTMAAVSWSRVNELLAKAAAVAGFGILTGVCLGALGEFDRSSCGIQCTADFISKFASIIFYALLTLLIALRLSAKAKAAGVSPR